MKTFSTSGIIVRVTPFRAKDQIAQLFTPENGLISLIAKQSAKQMKAPLAEMMEGEFLLRAGKGELLHCFEVGAVNHRIELRRSLPMLCSAVGMLDGIRKTQFPNKRAPSLFKLLQLYLDSLPQAADPYSLEASFLLKILRHEGMLNLSENCLACQQPLTTCYITPQGFFCSRHATLQRVILSEDDTSILATLATHRQLSRLLEIKASDATHAAAKTLFEWQLQ